MTKEIEYSIVREKGKISGLIQEYNGVRTEVELNTEVSEWQIISNILSLEDYGMKVSINDGGKQLIIA